ncbi:hypothetical protein [Streptomyces sp. NPDC001985]|uniref:hypothetical protein n=1 Tax=Streptomyces sp. NPDC001985 TaxID=3154406 RepID=UPI0033241798
MRQPEDLPERGLLVRAWVEPDVTGSVPWLLVAPADSAPTAADPGSATRMLRCARQQLLLTGAATLAPPAQS